MKKLLLSLAVLASAFSASALSDPTVITFTKNSTAYNKVSSYTADWTSIDGFWKFTGLNNNNNGWDFIAGGYSKSAVNAVFCTQVESPDPIGTVVATLGTRYTKSAIKSVTLYVADNEKFTDATETDVTSALPSAAGEDMTIDVNTTVAGQYVKVLFEIPQQSSNGQAISFTKITINYVEAGAAELKAAELAWSETSVELDENQVADFVAPTFSNPNNLAVAFSTSDENVAEVSEEGVITLTGDLGTATVSAVFEGNDEYRAQTVTCKITIVPAPVVVKSVKEAIALENKTDVVVDFVLTVGFVKNSNVFVCDENGDFIQIYGANSFKVGDVIAAGWKANYQLYGTTPELVPAAGTVFETTAGEFTAKEVAAADVTADLVNAVVVLKDVVFAEATPSNVANFTGSVGEAQFTFRNNYSLASVEAGTYDVTLVVSVYNGNVQLYPISYEESDTSAIDEIEAAGNAAVYYNLQGVQVANPENGIYIVRRGNNVTKELIRK